METIFYTVKEIADKLSLTEETIREKLRRKEIEGIKIGKGWRINEEKLKTFLHISAKG